MQNELLIRLSVFLAVFAGLAALERLFPRRLPLRPQARRWASNLGLVLIDVVVLRTVAFALPILAVAAALDASAMGVGLFNLTDWPLWLEFGLAVLALDLAVWVQHLVTHKVPLFWRFHRVHHADRDFDVTTALRFHPVEIIASAAFKVGLVYLLGPAALAVLAFEVLLNATAMFNHSNLALPRWLDGLVRLVLVTPDMHRVHHSVHREEHDSNYGFALSLWDRLFRTYRPQPMADHPTLAIGLDWQDEQPMRLGWMLMLPFRR
jgi:sterol desaturase/sphingolipid hydroxylase (fatty acid hydroxylase superfamily)